MRVEDLEEWQKNPESLVAQRIQFFKNGVRMTRIMEKNTAKDIVRQGKAFVISSQTIGYIKDGKTSD